MENNQNICENEKCVFLFNITPTLLLDITLVFGLQYIYIYIYIKYKAKLFTKSPKSHEKS